MDFSYLGKRIIRYIRIIIFKIKLIELGSGVVTIDVLAVEVIMSSVVFSIASMNAHAFMCHNPMAIAICRIDKGISAIPICVKGGMKPIANSMLMINPTIPPIMYMIESMDMPIGLSLKLRLLP